jgi:hypothetical protein
MPANKNELTRHRTKTADNPRGRAFAAEVYKGLARDRDYDDEIRQKGKLGAGARQRLAGEITHYYRPLTGRGQDHEQVRRVLDVEFHGFTQELVEAWCLAVPTIDRLAAYRAVRILPPELENLDDLKAVVRLLGRHGGNGDSDQLGRDRAIYSPRQPALAS